MMMDELMDWHSRRGPTVDRAKSVSDIIPLLHPFLCNSEWRLFFDGGDSATIKSFGHQLDTIHKDPSRLISSVVLICLFEYPGFNG